MAIGIATCVCLATWPAVTEYRINHPWPKRYATQIGESLNVEAAAGCLILLNTNSRVEVRSAPQHVRVALLQGEALFTITHNSSRLFEVTSGPATIADRGTTFSVRVHSDGVSTVLVSTGRVEVSDGSARQMVSAGEVATIRGERIQTRSTSVDRVQENLEWASGWLSFRDTSLGEAADEVNRYNRRRLIVDDPDVAAVRIAGKFRTTDLDSFIDSLAAVHIFGQRLDADTIRLVHRSSP